MKRLVISPMAEQVAQLLEQELRRGRWSGEMPGRDRLALELGVNRKTVERALVKLEERGLLAGAGPGRRRRIVIPADEKHRPALRVAILSYDRTDRGLPYMIDLQHRLEGAGHVAGFASRTLLELGQKASRVATFVERNPADAWVVVGGAYEINEWFAMQPLPAFALFGRRRGLDIAGTGPDKVPAIREIVRRLVALGHHRIVMLAREDRRKPLPGTAENAFLDELEAHGIATGSYHMPQWEETPAGFRHCLDQLFNVTPPTALILDETLFLGVARQHLAQRGIFSPQHVSLISRDPDPSFAWYSPSIAHIQWDPDQVVRRVVHWVNNVAQGKDDRRQTITKSEFIEGGTIGRVGH